MSSARQRPLAIMRPAMVLGLGLTLLLGAPLIGGCGTGQNTETANQQSAANGAEGQIGPIAVRNAQFAYPDDGEYFYPRGSDVPLLLTIANTGTAEDELTSATSPVAGSVRIEGQRALPAQRTLRAVAPSDGATQAAGQSLTHGQIRIVLEDIAEDVRPGRTVPVTLLFRQAGELTVNVPIAIPDGPRAESTH